MSENLDATSAGGEIHILPELTHPLDSKGPEESKGNIFEIEKPLPSQENKEPTLADIERKIDEIAKNEQEKDKLIEQQGQLIERSQEVTIGEKINELQETKHKNQRKLINGAIISAVGLTSRLAVPVAVDFLTKNPILVAALGQNVLTSIPILTWIGVTAYGGIKAGFNELKNLYLDHKIRQIEKQRDKINTYSLKPLKAV